MNLIGHEIWDQVYPKLFDFTMKINPSEYDYAYSNEKIIKMSKSFKFNLKNTGNLLITHFIPSQFYDENANMEYTLNLLEEIAKIYENQKSTKGSLFIITGNSGKRIAEKFSTLTLFMSNMLNGGKDLCSNTMMSWSTHQDLATSLAKLIGTHIPIGSIGLPIFGLISNLYAGNFQVLKETLTNALLHFEGITKCRFAHGEKCVDEKIVTSFESEQISFLMNDLKACERHDDEACEKLQFNKLSNIYSILQLIQSRLISHMNLHDDNHLLLISLVSMCLIVIIIWTQYFKYLYDTFQERLVESVKDQWSPAKSFRNLLFIFFLLIVLHSLSLSGNSYIQNENHLWAYYSPTVLILSIFPILLWHIHHRISRLLLFRDLLPVILVVAIDRGLSEVDHNPSTISKSTADMLNYLSMTIFLIVRFMSLKNQQIRPKIRMPGSNLEEYNIRAHYFLSWIMHWSPIMSCLGVFYVKMILSQNQSASGWIQDRVRLDRISLVMLALDILTCLFHNCVLVIRQRTSQERIHDPHRDMSTFLVMRMLAPGLITQTVFLFLFILGPSTVAFLWAVVLIKDILITHYCHVLIGRLPQDNTQVLKMILFMIFWTQSWLTFFQQGNSNMLDTINVSVGRFGQTFGNTFIAGLLIAFYTFSGFFYWISIFFFKILPLVSRRRKQGENSLQMSFTLGTIILPVGMFSLTCMILRHHQMTWSVFVPKLIYMAIYVTVVLPFYAVNVYVSGKL